MTTVLNVGGLVDVEAGRMVRDACIQVTDDRISGWGTQRDKPPLPPDARELWLTDDFALPGLISSHAHLCTPSGGQPFHLCQSDQLAPRLTGRPGTFMVAVGTAEHDSGQIAVSNNEWGVQQTDSRLVALKLPATYEDKAADAPLGSEYQECCDVAKALPTQEHYDMYRRVKDEIAGLGVEFPF